MGLLSLSMTIKSSYSLTKKAQKKQHNSSENGEQFIKNVGKKSNAFFAVDGVSADIEDGMIYGILGQNGAGKTTLLRMHP